ncbi:MAG: MFS transporter [Armatimonadetes bacterium]|nr:MFS transporter [Armatimonadota bacterium]
MGLHPTARAQLPSVEPATPQPWGPAALIVALNALAWVSYSAIGICAPAIGQSFGVPAAESLGFPAAVALGLVTAMPLTPWLVGRWGFRRVSIGCSLGLSAACLLAAVAPEPRSLMACLLLVGFTSAPLSPSSQALVMVRFSPGRQSFGMALWNAGGMLGLLLGSLGAGSLSQAVGWRAIFLLSVPVALASLWLLVREPEPAELVGKRPAFTFQMILLAGTTMALGGLLNLGPRLGWTSAGTIAIALVVLSLSGLYAWSYRGTSPPVLDWAVLRWPVFRLCVIFSLAISAFSTGQFENMMLGAERHFGPALLGWRAALGGLAAVGGAFLGARALRTGGFSQALWISLGVLLAGKLGFTQYGSPELSLFSALWPQIVSSLGYGMAGTVLSAPQRFRAFQRLSMPRPPPCTAWCGSSGTPWGSQGSIAS